MRKRINYKNIVSMGLAVPVFSLAAAGNTQAQGIDAPSCEALGYDLTEADCAGRLFLKCPFDQTKYFCPDETTSSDCKVGDILYSDKTCSAKVISGKTPIAVVFNIEKGLAIALKTEKKAWSTTFFDVPGLTNYSSPDSAKADWAGKNNTKLITAFCTSKGKSCPAFDYVNSYTTAGTTAGDWYLPATGELNAVYVNKGVLNTALSKVGGMQLPTDHYHWSSSEYEAKYASKQTFLYGTIYGSDKDYSEYVRPVLAYKDSGNSGGSVGTCTNPKVGDILYSDKTCSSDVVSGKTPIAVVFDVGNRLALALKTAKALWSTSYFDIPELTNYTTPQAASRNWCGKSSTLTVVQSCVANGISCPAFDYVNSYKTEGTNASDWHLPSIGELVAMYGDKSALNSSLTKANGQTLPDSLHWSSSEFYYNSAWGMDLYSSDIANHNKDDSNYVRPVLQF